MELCLKTQLFDINIHYLLMPLNSQTILLTIKVSAQFHLLVSF